jgi:4-amino-4-deoxy-L-arabinose transferase-like glycosyltransferase
MKNNKLIKNPFLLFLPFLILYITLVLIFSTTGTFGDESRYVMFAHNIINGFFSPPPPGIDLGNGPGYPIILIPFLAFNLPLSGIALLNAFLYYLSVVLLFKVLIQITSFRIAFIISLFWACYYNSYVYIVYILTEIFTSFLILLLIFSITRAFREGNPQNIKKYIFLSGFTIGYLALTKPIFGYVILVMLVFFGILWLRKRSCSNYRKGLIILLIAFTTIIPYLIYSYHLTNRIFYFTSVGGNNLYWMSSPYKGEYGNWIQYPLDPLDDNKRIPGSDDIINMHHQKDFDEIFKYKGVEQDDIYKKIVINNIKSHPIKYIENCFSNVGRILFNFPRSYEIQKPGTLLRLPLNGIIVVLMLFCLIPTIVSWRKIIFPIRFLLFFALIYFGGSILGSAETRMFTIIVPILLTWIAFIIQKSVKINFSWGKSSNTQM